jgi:hypothetical protein
VIPPISEPVTIAPDITVPVVFAGVVGLAYVDVDGSLEIPVTINANFDLGGQSFDIDFDFNVDLTDPTADPSPPPRPFPRNPDGRPNPSNCPPSPSCDFPPADPEPGDDIPGPGDPEDKAEFEVKAVQVLSVVERGATTATEIFWNGDAPNIWVPRLGSIKFVYQLIDQGVTFSTDIDVKATDVILPAPKVGIRCLGAIASPGRGIAMELFFIRGRVEEFRVCC